MDAELALNAIDPLTNDFALQEKYAMRIRCVMD